MPTIARIRLGFSAIPAVVAVLIFSALVWISASGVRGSDQYWYVADVESLLDGHGVQTNEIYPVAIRHEILPLPRPFVHNILNTYLAAGPAALLGAYEGWIALNFLSVLLTAFRIFCTVVRVCDSRPAALAIAASYLVLPLTVWLTTQPLAEASIAPFVALAVYLYVTAGVSYLRWTLLLMVVVLLVYCRESFVLLLPLIPAGYVAHSRPLRLARVGAAAGLVAIGGGLWLLGKFLFEPYISLSYLQTIASAGPNVSNMNTYFDLTRDTPTISMILGKAIHGLAVQFTEINIGYFLFYLPFNVLMLCPLAVWLARKRAEVDRVVAAAVAAVILHLITAVIVQNQFRYLLCATPPLLVAAGVLIASLPNHRTLLWLPVAGATAAILILSVPSAALAWHSHTDALWERDTRGDLAEAINETVPMGGSVMVAIDLSKPYGWQRLGYVLRPRRALFVSDRYSPDDYAALIHNANAKWLISRRDSPIFERLSPSVAHEARGLPGAFSDWSIFSLENTSRLP
jgi:hypothetical protein